MRLWHQALIPKLPRKQLLGQHRELCALRGNGWGRPHAVVNYVFKYDLNRLYQFHLLVIAEMERRGYAVDELWREPSYRGKNCVPCMYVSYETYDNPIYPEHDDAYMQECIDNLKEKGVIL